LIIEYGAILGLELSEDSTAADRWALTEVRLDPATGARSCDRADNDALA